MNGRLGAAVRYSAAAALTALLSLVAVRAMAPGIAGDAGSWLLLGWALMSAVHLAGGCWLVARHGTSGTGFLLALGVGMLGRLVAAASGAAGAWFYGEQAAIAYVWGLAMGFVPLQILEMSWFLRASRRQSARAGVAR